MRPIFLALFSLFFIGTFGVPQLERAIPTAFPRGEDGLPDPADTVAWQLEIQDLIYAMRKSFSKIGNVAFTDNPEIGANVVCILQDQLVKVDQIAFEYSNSIQPGRIRRNELGFASALPSSNRLRRQFAFAASPNQFQIPMAVRQTQDGGVEYHYRFRRQAGGGGDAYDKVGGALTETPGKLAGEQMKLSPGAQAEMDKEYVEGLKKCKSRECKSQLKTYEAGKG